MRTPDKSLSSSTSGAWSAAERRSEATAARRAEYMGEAEVLQRSSGPLCRRTGEAGCRALAFEWSRTAKRRKYGVISPGAPIIESPRQRAFLRLEKGPHGRRRVVETKIDFSLRLCASAVKIILSTIFLGTHSDSAILAGNRPVYK